MAILSRRFATAPVCIAALSSFAHAQRCGAELVSPSISLPNPTPQYRFENAALSSDGRFVAYHSMNGSLVAGDTNGVCDVFVYDRATGTTERVSVASDGSQIPANTSNWVAMYPAISGNGRYVAFSSNAPTLVAGDANGHFDVFVRDRQTSTTTRVSVDSTGAEQFGDSGIEAPILFPNVTQTFFNTGLTISADGRYVAFSSWAALDDRDMQTRGAYVHDRVTGTTTLVSRKLNGEPAMGAFASISADGRFVAFDSNAPNIVATPVNGQFQVYVHDLVGGTTEIVSISNGGAIGTMRSDAAPALSADGRFVAFRSLAPNLVAGDTNGQDDIFVRDRASATTEIVSNTWNGAPSNRLSTGPQISGDGRFVAFTSSGTNMVPGLPGSWMDAYLRDRVTHRLLRVPNGSACGRADEASLYPALSANGRVMAFESLASNLVASDPSANGWDLYVKDLSVLWHVLPH